MLRRKSGIIAVVALAPLMMASSVADNGDQYVCSIGKAIECDGDLNCGPPAPQQVAPTFIHLDLDDSRITLLAPEERRGEVTQIGAMVRDGDQVILSGIEAGRGWSLSMSESTGKMSITINFGDAGWIVFGQCMAEDQASPRG
jgi:hypothetical protein